MQAKRSPWTWIPTLYFAEGLPYIVITTVSLLVMSDMGLSDAKTTLYTGWLGLPWILKPLWSPFVDIIKTKRWWVILTQAVLGSAFAGVAFTIPTGFWFQSLMFFLFLAGFTSATHDIAADGYYMIELDTHQQSFFVGIRNTVYRLAMIFGSGFLVWLAGYLQKGGGTTILSWCIVFYALAGIFIAITLYHAFCLPRSEGDVPRSASFRETGRLLGESLGSFFVKFPVRETVLALLFILLFRLPEAMLGKISPLFLTRSVAEGGLGLTKEQFGLFYSTIGTIGLVLGGILGGIAASRHGLKKWLWPMVVAITVPDVVYVYFSYAHPTSLPLISSFIFVEQLGYGFGFTALTLYMLYYSIGKFKTSHYSICTGITFLGLMLPGMISGYLAERLGYQHFFILIMALCAVTFLVAALIRIDPDFGKSKTA